MAHDLANGLRARREAARLSRPELAEISGVTARSIEAYERGEAVPNVLTARALATALGVSLDDLLATVGA